MFTTEKSLPSAKSLPTTKSLAFTKFEDDMSAIFDRFRFSSKIFTKFLVIDKHLIDENLNLSNMTEMLSSNNFGHWKLLKW